MITRTLAVILVLGACGGGSQQVRPDEMSAAGHRSEAERERSAARLHLDHWEDSQRDRAAVPGAQGLPFLESMFWFEPRSSDLADAEQHAVHARQHQEAAETLERFEAEQCTGIPEDSRNACYLLGPIVATHDVPGGVLLTFGTPADVPAIAAHLRCHFAWARARGFAEEASCPLDLGGLEINVVGGRSIEITSRDPATAREIRRRVRWQSTPAWIQ